MQLGEDLQRVLTIRYVKLHYKIQFIEDCELTHNKVSAIRGGMGEMLLRENCISDRNCEQCGFEEECLVQRTMYSKFRVQPQSTGTGDSIGYVIECENYEKDFKCGDTLDFSLILFGKTIVYFNIYMQALYALGLEGLGSKKAKFQIIEVTNTLRQPILDGMNLYMERYQSTTLLDYVEHRLRYLNPNQSQWKIDFKTPLTQKYQGEFLEQFDMNAIVQSVKRRMYLLDCFEDIDAQEWRMKQYAVPIITEQEAIPTKVTRFSNRKNERVELKGIRGTVRLGEIDEELLPLLVAGEMTHIGKNTSFGFGRYVLR